jgi:phospholipase/carboxylesterase
MQYTPPIEYIYTPEQPANNPDTLANGSIIWLHGLGADGADFAPVAKELALPHVRFILPHAPMQAVTINNGYVMPAWYDLYGLTLGSLEDEIGIERSKNYLEGLINQEIARGISAKRIVIAGFSQGGAMALHAALRFPERLAGVLALSTYLPLKAQLAQNAHSSNAKTPIFMAHGLHDDVISLATAEVSMQLLRLAGYPLDFHTYPMAHSVCMEEIADIRSFLQQVLVE